MDFIVNIPILNLINHSNNYTLLVSVLLSAQSTDKKVNEVTKELFKMASDPLAMYELNEKDIYELIKELGISKQKNENAYKLEKFKLNDSRVYCFTDGFSESLDENKNEIGINGVKELLKRNQNSKLKIELEKVTEEIRQKSLKKEYKEKGLEEDKGILDDDLTILGIGK